MLTPTLIFLLYHSLPILFRKILIHASKKYSIFCRLFYSDILVASRNSMTTKTTGQNIQMITKTCVVWRSSEPDLRAKFAWAGYSGAPGWIIQPRGKFPPLPNFAMPTSINWGSLAHA
jgi:hypothetical protein